MNIINTMELNMIKKRINRKIRKGCPVMIVYHMSNAVFEQLKLEGVNIKYDSCGKYTIKLDKFLII